MFDAARTVADAVLFEGYVLYPYRASATKNQMRFQFGVLVPPAYQAQQPSEASALQAECILDPGQDPRVHVLVRCLHLQTRVAHDQPAWDEGIVREVSASLDVASLLAGGHHVVPFRFPQGAESDGRVVRTCWPVAGRLVLSCARVAGPYGALKVRVRVENTTVVWPPGTAFTRDQALRSSLASAHVLLAAEDAAFVSLTDPPEWARSAVQECTNEGVWPILVGEPGRCDVVLASPIILYDYPRIAPESSGDLFDATEIDEILTLRTLTLTEDEKQQARATDARAAELMDRVDALPAEVLERLHGTIRSLRRATAQPAAVEAGPPPLGDPAGDPAGAPETHSLWVAGQRVARGSRVRLKPGARRADAQDMFLANRVASVEGVVTDVDGEHYLAVTLADDPVADLFQAQGRFLYFKPDEVEPLGGTP